MATPSDAAESTWREPAAGEKAGWGSWERPPTPYDRFMEHEGIPVYRDIGVRTVRDLPLEPWARVGGRGSYIQVDGTEGEWGMYVVEVPGGGALNVERDLYEKVVFVIEGRGTTEVWQRDEGKKQVFEWNEGSLFAIPLNSWHRIVNATSRPALLLVGTTGPNIMNLLRDEHIVFNLDYAFRDRFDDDDEYFHPRDDLEPDPIMGLAMRRSNLIPDIVGCTLPLDNRRSPGYRRVQPKMGGSDFYMFCGEHETGRYSKAHKHASGAVLICISGKGYTYTWPSELGTQPWKDGNGDQVRRQDYVAGGMVSAAPMNGDWFHQHFGVSKQPLRLLAWFGIRGPRQIQGRPGAANRDQSSIDVKEGGNAIEYRDEDPHIREEFERMLAVEGAESRMTDEVYDATFTFHGRQTS